MTNRNTPSANAESPEVLAVIMARGGSVGVPKKALRSLLGRPVMAYTLDHVRQSKRITRSIVSSDDAEILATARAANFETLERPAHLATATSATDPVLRHALSVLYPKPASGNQSSALSPQSSPLPAAVVMLYANVPIRANAMIDRCIDLLFSTNADSVQTIAPVGKMHPYWMFDRDDAGRIKKHIPNNVFRRQDLPPLFSPTGAVYVMKTAVLMAAEGSPDPHAFLGHDRRGLVVGPEDSVDIDTPKDLFIAEAVLRMQAEESR